MEYELSVAPDGNAMIEFQGGWQFSRAGFESLATQLAGLMSLQIESAVAQSLLESADAPAPKFWIDGSGFENFETDDNTEIQMNFVGGYVLRMEAIFCEMTFPTPLSQYEAAIRMKTELRWKPLSRVYAWAPVGDDVEELIGVLYSTLALLVYDSFEYEQKNEQVVHESMGQIMATIAAIRNGDKWSVEDVHTIYFSLAGSKPDDVPPSWSEKFLAYAGLAGKHLTSYQSSLKLQ